MAERKISELENVEFRGSLGEAFTAYAEAAQGLTGPLAFELEVAANDAEAAMAALKGHPLLLGIDTRIRARRVAKRLKRAAELAEGIGKEVGKFPTEYRRQIVDR
jgi:hypothetical protein